MKSAIAYYGEAELFLEQRFQLTGEARMPFFYHFIVDLAMEAKAIGESCDLNGNDIRNAMIASLFRYAGFSDFGSKNTEPAISALNDFFNKTDYPSLDRRIVETTVRKISSDQHPETKLEKVASDATFSFLSDPALMEKLMLIKKEHENPEPDGQSDLSYLTYFRSLMIANRFCTPYAMEHYSVQMEKNLEILTHKIHHIESNDNKPKKKHDVSEQPILSNKETEDLFKIAFRNYNHLISVADSKAALLIRVNSVVISIIIAFLIGKGGRSLSVLWPALLLLTVSLITIMLSILASRPQNSRFLEDRKSRSYQRFFFGSFDMVDAGFLTVAWEVYLKQ